MNLARRCEQLMEFVVGLFFDLIPSRILDFDARSFTHVVHQALVAQEGGAGRRVAPLSVVLLIALRALPLAQELLAVERLSCCQGAARSCLFHLALVTQSALS